MLLKNGRKATLTESFRVVVAEDPQLALEDLMQLGPLFTVPSCGRTAGSQDLRGSAAGL